MEIRWQLATRFIETRNSELGSIAPLGIGLATLSLTVVLVSISASSAYLTDRRLTFIAESTAYAVLSESDGELNLSLTALAEEFIQQHPLRGIRDLQIVSVSASDQQTVRVRLCSKLEPIIPSYVFSEVGTICSEGLARRGR